MQDKAKQMGVEPETEDLEESSDDDDDDDDDEVFNHKKLKIILIHNVSKY